MKLDVELRAVAERQHGVIARRQARAAAPAASTSADGLSHLTGKR